MFYSLWNSDKTTNHHGKYYNMKPKKYMWINESDLPQLEHVSPDITLGIDECEGADVIREKLDSIKDVENEFVLLH
jgi:hypothetical protein